MARARKARSSEPVGQNGLERQLGFNQRPSSRDHPRPPGATLPPLTSRLLGYEHPAFGLVERYLHGPDRS